VWKRTRWVKGREHQSAVVDCIDSLPLQVHENKTSKFKKAKKHRPSATDEVEFVDINALKALREAALDQQYCEDVEQVWASVPDDEILPTDRASSRFQHLLE
jgi:hypothetical protein